MGRSQSYFSAASTSWAAHGNGLNRTLQHGAFYIWKTEKLSGSYQSEHLSHLYMTVREVKTTDRSQKSDPKCFADTKPNQIKFSVKFVKSQHFKITFCSVCSCASVLAIFYQTTYTSPATLLNTEINDILCHVKICIKSSHLYSEQK